MPSRWTGPGSASSCGQTCRGIWRCTWGRSWRLVAAVRDSVEERSQAVSKNPEIIIQEMVPGEPSENPRFPALHAGQLLQDPTMPGHEGQSFPEGLERRPFLPVPHQSDSEIAEDVSVEEITLGGLLAQLQPLLGPAVGQNQGKSQKRQVAHGGALVGTVHLVLLHRRLNQLDGLLVLFVL